MPPAPQEITDKEPIPTPGGRESVVQEPADTKKVSRLGLVILLLVVVAGLVTGRVLSRSRASSSTGEVAKILSSDKKEVGIKDEKTFNTCASGTLEINETNGKKTEGSHKLIREGGPSQTLYMVSSVVPLDDYLGKNVEVCGQTLNSKLVPWFMDIGKLKLI